MTDGVVTFEEARGSQSYTEMVSTSTGLPTTQTTVADSTPETSTIMPKDLVTSKPKDRTTEGESQTAMVDLGSRQQPHKLWLTVQLNLRTIQLLILYREVVLSSEVLSTLKL